MKNRLAISKPFNSLKVNLFISIYILILSKYFVVSKAIGRTVTQDGITLRCTSEQIDPNLYHNEFFCRCFDGQDYSYGLDCNNRFPNPCIDGSAQHQKSPSAISESYFIHCTNKVPHLFKCPANLIWNDEEKTCSRRKFISDMNEFKKIAKVVPTAPLSSGFFNEVQTLRNFSETYQPFLLPVNKVQQTTVSYMNQELSAAQNDRNKGIIIKSNGNNEQAYQTLQPLNNQPYSIVNQNVLNTVNEQNTQFLNNEQIVYSNPEKVQVELQNSLLNYQLVTNSNEQPERSSVQVDNSVSNQVKTDLNNVVYEEMYRLKPSSIESSTLQLGLDKKNVEQSQLNTELINSSYEKNNQQVTFENHQVFQSEKAKPKTNIEQKKDQEIIEQVRLHNLMKSNIEQQSLESNGIKDHKTQVNLSNGLNGAHKKMNSNIEQLNQRSLSSTTSELNEKRRDEMNFNSLNGVINNNNLINMNADQLQTRSLESASVLNSQEKIKNELNLDSSFQSKIEKIHFGSINTLPEASGRSIKNENKLNSNHVKTDSNTQIHHSELKSTLIANDQKSDDQKIINQAKRILNEKNSLPQVSTTVFDSNGFNEQLTNNIRKQIENKQETQLFKINFDQGVKTDVKQNDLLNSNSRNIQKKSFQTVHTSKPIIVPVSTTTTQPRPIIITTKPQFNIPRQTNSNINQQPSLSVQTICDRKCEDEAVLNRIFSSIRTASQTQKQSVSAKTEFVIKNPSFANNVVSKDLNNNNLEILPKGFQVLLTFLV